MLAVPSFTPATTGIPAAQPERRRRGRAQRPERATRTAEPPRSSTPARRPPSRSPAANAVSWPCNDVAASPDSHSPSASQADSSQRRPIDGAGSCARQPRHRRQQPEPAAAPLRRGPPVLPRDRRAHGLAGSVDRRQRRPLAHPADADARRRRRHRSTARPPRPPPTSRPATAPRARRRRRRAGTPARPSPSSRPSSPIAAAFASVVPRSIPMTAGTRRGRRPVSHARGRPRPPPPRGARTSAASRSRARPRPPSNDGADGATTGRARNARRLVEVAGQPRLRLVVPVRRPGHAPVVVADVAQARRRLRPAGAVVPQAGRRLERVVGQQPPAVGGHEVHGVEEELEHRLADEVVEVDPHPAGLDALAAAGDLALELVRGLEVDARAAGARTGPRTSSRRATGCRTGR